MAALRHEDDLRLLAVNDEAFLSAQMTLDQGCASGRTIDAKTFALVRLAAVLASEPSSSSCHWSASRALEAGATPSEVVDVLLAVAPVIGAARIVAAAPDLARGIGYDIDAALEGLGTP